MSLLNSEFYDRAALLQLVNRTFLVFSILVLRELYSPASA